MIKGVRQPPHAIKLSNITDFRNYYWDIIDK